MLERRPLDANVPSPQCLTAGFPSNPLKGFPLRQAEADNQLQLHLARMSASHLTLLQ